MFQAPAVAAPRRTGSTAPPAQTEVGEFTKMFQAPKAPPAPHPRRRRVSAGQGTRRVYAHVPGQPDPRSRAAAGRNEIRPQRLRTVIRDALSRWTHAAQPRRAAAPRPASTRRLRTNRIGEFTQTFGKGTFDLASVPPAAAPASKEPGEFTRMFHSPGAAGHSTPPVTPQATPGAPPAFAVRRRPSPRSPAVPAITRASFQRPRSLPLDKLHRSVRAPAPGPQAYAPPAMAQPAMPNMAQAPMPPKKSNLVLILGVVGIVVVIALLVVFFVMRPK